MDKYTELKKRFEANRDDENAVNMAAYMRNRFSFYGLPTPTRRAVYKELLRVEKRGKVIDWDLLDKCYADEHREFQYFVYDYLSAMSGVLVYDDIFRIEKYIREKQWWDTIDFLSKVVGEIGLKDERVDKLMTAWSADGDLWVRRTAILHQLGRKGKTNTRLLETVIENNLGSHEFFVNKAIGWALRDHAKTDPDWVRAFVQMHRDEMDKLSVKEAGKYL